jgi:hypothetical protein
MHPERASSSFSSVLLRMLLSRSNTCSHKSGLFRMQQSHLHELWQESLQNTLFNVSAPPACSVHDSRCSVAMVRRDCFRQKVLMDVAIAAINDTISHKHRNGRLTAGAVVVLHLFSRGLGFNPQPIHPALKCGASPLPQADFSASHFSNFPNVQKT